MNNWILQTNIAKSCRWKDEMLKYFVDFLKSCHNCLICFST